jgi:hypothetical protein
MSRDSALLSFSIGPVHTFIAQARRVADQWAGSRLLSHLVGHAIETLSATPGAAVVFPYIDDIKNLPRGLPNRFVCRVPLSSADDIARAMRDAVLAEWDAQVGRAVTALATVGIEPSPAIWQDGQRGDRQTDSAIDVSWSWVPEVNGYPEAARRGMTQLAASRVFRPSAQSTEQGEKCAICGERTALPDGDRNNVRRAWHEAEERAKEQKDAARSLEPFFRVDQGRLCLVCATKRLYPHFNDSNIIFSDFGKYTSESSPYFAVVAMDGDQMGQVLGWGEERMKGKDVEAFHSQLSRCLSSFADSLRTPTATLQLAGFKDTRWWNPAPQLIYAGGEDVLLICHPRAAIAIAREIRDRYLDYCHGLAGLLANDRDVERLTISAAVLFAHSKWPAGLLFREVQDLLDRKAKQETGRNALALRLNKRSGVPVEVAFKWQPGGDQPDLLALFEQLVEVLGEGDMASRQTFNLAVEERVLGSVISTVEDWQVWLRSRLSRAELGEEDAGSLARLISPFFQMKQAQALRIARFLAMEIDR